MNESYWPRLMLLQGGFVDCFSALGLPARPTHPCRPSVAHEDANADQALDWIFARASKAGSGQLTPLAAMVVSGMVGLSSDDPDEKFALGVAPSDHCAVVAVYRL